MVKNKRTGNRLSMGSWNLPFLRSDSSSPREEKAQSKRQSRIFSAAPPPPVVATAKEAELETASEDGRTSTVPTTDAAPPAAAAIVNGGGAKPSTSSLVELAAIITRETEKLDRFLRESGSPVPSFDVDAPSDFPELPGELKMARETVVRATKELGDLVTGPREKIRWMAWDFNDSLSLHAVYHYRIAKSFPVGETATYSQIAEKVGLDETNVRRFCRHAMTNRIFREVDPNTIAHTAGSKVLAEDDAMDAWVGFCVEDIWPAASQTVTALKLNPSASEPNQTGFCAANNTTNTEPMYVTFAKSPQRAKRMGGAMTSLTGGEGYEVSYLLQMYPWASLPPTATIVDLGGSHGTVCIELAKQYPSMHFTVQDLPKTIASAPLLPAPLSSRVLFQAHDFFEPQPVKAADVYLFRWILHNHSDKYSIRMLRALIPALKKGARVVINDHCLRDGYGQEKTLWDEKIIRTMDLVMLTLLNAKERSEKEFRDLFAAADAGFRFVGVRREEGCRMSVVEAVWEGEDFGGGGGGGEVTEAEAETEVEGEDKPVAAV